MIENKFRVWCKNKNEWEKDTVCITGTGQLFHIHNGNIVPLKEDSHIIQWYTGLKDKNGKDIYEGDILKVLTRWYKSAKNEADKFNNGIKGETLWTVEHKIFNCEMGFMIYGLDRRFHKLMTQSMMWNTQAEVIGNIYENPELLQQYER